MTQPTSFLATDKYKMAMALAGFPLRRETFVFSLRKGGPWVMPVDPEKFVRSLLPDTGPSSGGLLGMPDAYWDALGNTSEVVVRGLPKGSWFSDREPILTITGPSALVSNLEARIIGELTFRIQTATIAKLAVHTLDARFATVTCERERDIVMETLDSVNVTMGPPDVDSDGYWNHIWDRAQELVNIAEDSDRLMEAGYRAVSCLEQHRIALQAVKKAGFTATSNVLLAKELGMRAAGTTGHEHTQRWGSDYAAFTAVRDSIPGDVTYLLDTFSTRHSGLPTALRVMLEDPTRACSVRFDSESTMRGDYLLATELFREHGLEPGLNLGGGFNADITRRFEELRVMLGWPAEKQRYMYGQYLVEPHVPLPTRGDVGAVYKLSKTGSRATMKFSDNPAKSSSPGVPIVFRLAHPGGADFTKLPLGIIGQDGEDPPEHYRMASSNDRIANSEQFTARFRAQPAANSPATQALVDQCVAAKVANITSALT